MNREKVGILAVGSKHGGGIYQYTQSMIDALKNDEQREYIIFCNENDNSFDDYDLEIRKIKKKELSFYQKLFRYLQLLFIVRTPFFFSKEEQEIFKDISLFISPQITPYPHFFLNKPFIFTLHDMQERYFPKFFTLRVRIIRWLNNRALSLKADKIICESDYVKNDIVKFTGVNKEKIYVIQSPPPQHFLNLQIEDKTLIAVKNKYNLPDEFIFYPAQAWFHKNHIKLIEAFNIVQKKRKNIYLILTGSQQNNYVNVIKKIDQLNLTNKIKHLGYIDYDDLPCFYKLSKFLVMPTLFESVSIPIYEAFSLGVPVCSSNVVALPEQVGNAGLIFDANDANDMAEKMLSYIDDAELREEKAKLGLAKVKLFNHSNYREKLLRMLVGSNS